MANLEEAIGRAVGKAPVFSSSGTAPAAPSKDLIGDIAKISALLGALLYGLVFRPLRNAPPLAKEVASLGVLVILQGSMANRMGTTPVIVQAIYPSNRWTWQDMTLLSDRVYLAITVIVLTLVILRAGMPPDGSQAGGSTGSIEAALAPDVSGMW